MENRKEKVERLREIQNILDTLRIKKSDDTVEQAFTECKIAQLEFEKARIIRAL